MNTPTPTPGVSATEDTAGMTPTPTATTEPQPETTTHTVAPGPYAPTDWEQNQADGFTILGALVLVVLGVLLVRAIW